MKDDRFYLIHMCECIDYITQYTAEGRDAFMASRQAQDAVIRNFEVLGEAAKHLSEAFRSSHEGIPWKRIVGFRDVLIHHYIGVDIEQVWSVVEKDLPDLGERIRKLKDGA